MNWLRKIMAGRYGVDQLAIAQLVMAVVLAITYGFFPYSLIRLAYVFILVYTYIRIFSKNTNKRYMENLKFLEFWNPIRIGLSKRVARLKSMKDFKYFKCSFCDQKIRIPRGKGKIKVTCPNCKNVTIKKT